MRKIDNRDVRVAIAVHDQLTQKSYSTRAFPTGQGPGLFSAPVSFDENGATEIHWIHVTIRDEEARILGGNKVAAPTFQLDPVYESKVELVNGTARADYDVARRYRISIAIYVVPRKPSSELVRADRPPHLRGRDRSSILRPMDR